MAKETKKPTTSEPEKKWELLPEHEAQIPAWREKWLKHMFTTEPMNFKATAEAVYGMCDVVKVPHMRTVGCVSIIQGVIALAWISAWHDFVAQLKETKCAKAIEMIPKAPKITLPSDTLRQCSINIFLAGIHPDKTFSYNPIDEYKAAVKKPPTNSDHFVEIYESLRNLVRSMVPDELLAQITKACDTANKNNTFKPTFEIITLNAGDELRNWYSYFSGGNEWSSWPAYLSFIHDVIGFSHEPETSHYRKFEAAAIHGGPRLLHPEVALLCERPVRRCIRENGRGGHEAHCEDGPSYEWWCGYRLWHLNGMDVDEQLVLRPETQTIQQIDKESNNDIRALRLARFGEMRYIKESNAKVVDSRNHPRDGTPEKLYRLANKEMRFIVVDPSTNENVVLNIPETVTTCAAAQAYLSHGLDEFAHLRT